MRLRDCQLSVRGAMRPRLIYRVEGLPRAGIPRTYLHLRVRQTYIAATAAPLLVVALATSRRIIPETV